MRLSRGCGWRRSGSVALVAGGGGACRGSSPGWGRLGRAWIGRLFAGDGGGGRRVLFAGDGCGSGRGILDAKNLALLAIENFDGGAAGLELAEEVREAGRTGFALGSGSDHGPIGGVLHAACGGQHGPTKDEQAECANASPVSSVAHGERVSAGGGGQPSGGCVFLKREPGRVAAKTPIPAGAGVSADGDRRDGGADVGG